MKKSSKILIIGHMRHGKDTVAEMIQEKLGLNFKSSSMMAVELILYKKLKDKYGYTSMEECYEDRVNHRKEWYDLICEYNKDDKARLAKDIVSISDMYVGMRDLDELEKCIKDQVFDLILGVFDPSKPLEPKESFNINIFEHSDFIIPTGDLEATKLKVDKVCLHLFNSFYNRIFTQKIKANVSTQKFQRTI